MTVPSTIHATAHEHCRPRMEYRVRTQEPCHQVMAGWLCGNMDICIGLPEGSKGCRITYPSAQLRISCHILGLDAFRIAHEPRPDARHGECHSPSPMRLLPCFSPFQGRDGEKMQCGRRSGSSTEQTPNPTSATIWPSRHKDWTIDEGSS